MSGVSSSVFQVIGMRSLKFSEGNCPERTKVKTSKDTLSWFHFVKYFMEFAVKVNLCVLLYVYYLLVYMIMYIS